jgi:hypothetical protein
MFLRARARIHLLWLVLLLGVSACLDRSRINAACRWSDPVAGPLNPHDATQRRHLREDALVAEELGIQLGDSFRGRLSVAERGLLRQACTDSLFQVIAAAHQVSIAEIREAGTERDIAIDIGVVMVPMVVLFVLVARHYAARALRAFDPEERVIILVAVGLMALAVSGLSLMVGTLWAWLVEMVRIGNSHLSYRAGRLPWREHVGALFVGAVLIFWSIAWLRWRTAHAPSHHSA